MRTTSLLSLIAMGVMIVAGCGGGGGTSIQPPATTPTGTISGVLSAPDAQTKSRQSVLGTVVSGAKVEAINLETSLVIATTTSGSDGSFRLTNLPLNVNIRIRATKSVTGGTLTLEAIVPITTATEIKKDLDPTTTVAAKVLDEILNGEAKPGDVKKDVAAIKQAMEKLEAEVKEQQQDPANAPDLRNVIDVTPITVVIGNIQVTSNPSGASVILDGTATGSITPCEFRGIHMGNHTVTVKLNGYQDATKVDEVKGKGTTAFPFVLGSIPAPTVSVTPVMLGYRGGAVTLSASASDANVAWVTVEISIPGMTPLLVQLAKDGAAFTGSAGIPANGGARPANYRVKFTLKDATTKVLYEVEKALNVEAIQSPPGGPGM